MSPDLVVPDTFSAWLRERRRRLALPGIGLILPLVSSAGVQIQDVLTWRWLFPVLIAFQLTVIAILLFVLPHPLEDQQQSPRASIAVEQFAFAWRMVWFFWFLEFLGLAIREAGSLLLPASAHDGSDLAVLWFAVIAPTILNLLNNLPTIALVMCYIVASEQTVTEINGTPKARRLPWDRAIVVLAVLTVLELMVRLNHQYSIVPLTQNLPQVFAWLSGLAACLATALVVGRLDSKFLNLPHWMLVLLYTYASIQAGWSTFDDSPATRAVLLNAALALKFLFFLLMWWLFKSGVLLFYIERIGRIHEGSATERALYLSRVQRPMRKVPDSAGPPTHTLEVG